jgi:hypothetical protein
MANARIKKAFFNFMVSSFGDLDAMADVRTLDPAKRRLAGQALILS